jgi:hypothetical protein
VVEVSNKQKTRRLARQKALMDVLEFFVDELTFGDHRDALTAQMTVLRDRVSAALDEPTIADMHRMKVECDQAPNPEPVK